MQEPEEERIMTSQIEVTVPDIGDFTGVPVIELLVAPGDRVELDDPLLTLESDKATMDIPAPADGVVAEFRVGLGDEVSQGDVLLVIESEEAGGGEPVGADGSEAAAGMTVTAVPDDPHDPPESLPVSASDAGAPGGGETPARSGAAAAAPSPATGKQSSTAAPSAPLGESQTTSSPGPSGDPPAPPSEVSGEAGGTRAGWALGDPRAPDALRRPPPTASLPSFPGRRTGTFHATPSVRRFARALGVDLSQITGTGRKGRILEEDVRRHVKEYLTAPAAPAAGDGAKADTAGGPGGSGAVSGLPSPPVIDFSRFGETQTMPLSRIKRRTAANLSRAWLAIPLVTHFDETDVTELEEFRRSLRGDPDARGARITLLAFAMKALVAALRKFPTFNASLAPDGESLILKHYFHLGIAVDTPEGLVVPVVRDVDRKRLTDLSFELADVSERARERKLRPDDVQGSCMTISSLGGIGGTAFAPLVNPPEVAILGLARARVAPVWNGREFEPRTVLPISLSYDHRVIDGAEAARFCRHLCLLLADVRRLVL